MCRYDVREGECWAGSLSHLVSIPCLVYLPFRLLQSCWEC